MAVRKLRSCWWVDFRANGKRHRIRSPENTRAGAAAFEQVLRGRLARGEPIVPSEEKRISAFAEFAAEWFETYVKTNNKRSEQMTKEIILRVHLLPFFGQMRIDEVTTAQIERYKANKLAGGLSWKTVNNHLAALAKCLRCAEEWEVIAKRPRIQLLRGISGRFDFLSTDEAAQLLSDETEPMWHEMALLALRAGLRRGELIALDWSDVSLERRMITVRRSVVEGVIETPKSIRIRHIPLAHDLIEALSKRQRRKGLVFSADEDGLVLLTKGKLARAIERLGKRAGVPRARWHILRHTFASHLVMSGVELPVVQKLLGHSSITTTMQYVHLAPNQLQSAVEKLLCLEQGAGRETLGNPWATQGDSAPAVETLVLPTTVGFSPR